MKTEDKILKREIEISKKLYKESLYFTVKSGLEKKKLVMNLNKEEDFLAALDMLDIDEPENKVKSRCVNITVDKYRESKDYLDICRLGFFLVDSFFLEKGGKYFAVIIFLDMSEVEVPSLSGITVSMPDVDINDEFINLAFKEYLLSNSKTLYKNSLIVEKGDVITYDKIYTDEFGKKRNEVNLVTEVFSNTYSKDVYENMLELSVGENYTFIDSLSSSSDKTTTIIIKEIFATDFDGLSIKDYKNLDNKELADSKNILELKENFIRKLESEVSYEMIFNMGEEIVIELVKKINLLSLPLYFKFKYFMLTDIPVRDKDLIEDDMEENRYLDLYKIVILKLVNDLNLEPIISKEKEDLDQKKYGTFTLEHSLNGFDMSTLIVIYKYLIKCVNIEVE